MTRVSGQLGDITTFEVDAVVNAANSHLAAGSGVCGAIYRAGGDAIFDECARIVAASGPVGVGHAAMTGGGRLTARHVIHAVGPVWSGRDAAGDDRRLASCYRESLDLAAGAGLASVAFPSISTGVFGFPPDRAAGVAVAAVRGWVADHPDSIDDVVFVCFDHADRARYASLLDDRDPWAAT